MRKHAHKSLISTTAVILAVFTTVAWLSAIAAPRCYPSRFEVQSSGRVYDAMTGLTWKQNVESAVYNWSGAVSFCLGQGTGWRLPTMTELQTIVDDARAAFPPIDPAFPNTPAELFWTASPAAGQPGHAWAVSFEYGEVGPEDASAKYRVRCVR